MTTDIRVSYLRRFLQRLWPAAANGILNWNLAGCGRGGAMTDDPIGAFSEGSETQYQSQPGRAAAAWEGSAPGDLVLGRYRLDRVIGRGGMGIVFQAQDIELERPVAVKRIRREMVADGTAGERFLKEARAAAGVGDPHVVQVYHSGVEDGEHYLIMEYIEGRGLDRSALDEVAPSLGQFISVIRQIVAGIKAIHDRGILHRDIKPSNIVLDRSGTVKVMDFGLARPLAAEAGLTSTGISVGTPRYMSPEQLRGGVIDRRSDLYALGMTLFEAVVGKVRDEAPNPARELRRALRRRATASQAALGLPRLLADLILKNLRPRPEDRWQSADEFLAALAPAEERARGRPLRLGWKPLAAAAVLAVACVIAWRIRFAQRPDLDGLLSSGNFREAIGWLSRPSSGRSPRDLYALGYCRLKTGEMGEAERIFGQIPSSPADAAALKKEGEIALASIRGRTEEVEGLGRSLSALPLAYSWSHTLLGETALAAGRLDEALAAFDRALRAPAVFPFQKASAYAGIGRVMRLRGRGDEALENYRRALDYAPRDRSILTGIGMAYAEEGRMDEAMGTLEKALRDDPADQTVRYLLETVAAKRGARAEDAARSQRVRALIAELEEKKMAPKAGASGDDWTSRPIAVAVLDLESPGGPLPAEGLALAYPRALAAALQTAPGITVVDRELLEDVLTELDLGASELASPAAALKLGRILSAGFMVAGSLWRSGTEVEVQVRLIDSETTALAAILSGKIDPGDLGGSARKLAAGIGEAIRHARPLQGRILSRENDTVVLNIGAETGLSRGRTLDVIEDEEIRQGGQSIGRREKVIGRITVTDAEAGSSRASLLQSSGPLPAGSKVRESEPSPR